jgi:hypothetical protein
MDRETLLKKQIGRKYALKRKPKNERICQKHNLPCHWADICAECVREKINGLGHNLRLFVDSEIMEKLLVKFEKPIRRERKLKPFL